MAGFDLENQRHAKTVGMCFDGGTFDFSTGSATADVATFLVRTMSGLAIAKLDSVDTTQQTMMAYMVGDPSNGMQSFVRAGGNINEDAQMSYWMMGF